MYVIRRRRERTRYRPVSPCLVLIKTIPMGTIDAARWRFRVFAIVESKRRRRDDPNGNIYDITLLGIGTYIYDTKRAEEIVCEVGILSYHRQIAPSKL